jgi:hypothetical protein
LAASKTKDNEDEEEESDDSEKSVSPGPKKGYSDSGISTDKEATAKSKAIHAKDHTKREQEKKKEVVKRKNRQAKENM